MFSLSGATKFKYIPNYKDMRGGYDKLHGVVCSLGGEQEEGTAYVFTSRNQKLVKLSVMSIMSVSFICSVSTTI